VLILNCDISDVIEKHQNLADQLESKTKEAIEKLSAMMHAHIIDTIVPQKLKSTRDQFIEGLKLKKIDETAWEIVIPEDLAWIEDGIKAGFDMLPGFLKSPKAKSGKNGKYLVIPFKHNKAPTRQSPLQAGLTKIIKDEMKKKSIPYGKIESKADGSPKIGRLHHFNISSPTHLHSVPHGHQGPQGHKIATHAPPQGHEGPGGRPYLWRSKCIPKTCRR
jgi:hypothetical protein